MPGILLRVLQNDFIFEVGTNVNHFINEETETQKADKDHTAGMSQN